MVRWHHRLNGYEFEQIPRDGEEQGSLMCCSPWGCKELDTTERLKNSDNSPLALGQTEIQFSEPQKGEKGGIMAYIWYLGKCWGSQQSLLRLTGSCPPHR